MISLYETGTVGVVHRRAGGLLQDDVAPARGHRALLHAAVAPGLPLPPPVRSSTHAHTQLQTQPLTPLCMPKHLLTKECHIPKQHIPNIPLR